MPLEQVQAHSLGFRAKHAGIPRGKMEQSDQKIGMCNYCQELGPIYEQEDENRVIFLICKRCITDVIKRLEIDQKMKKLRARKEWDRYDT
jgi:hypothetical protein